MTKRIVLFFFWLGIVFFLPAIIPAQAQTFPLSVEEREVFGKIFSSSSQAPFSNLYQSEIVPAMTNDLPALHQSEIVPANQAPFSNLYQSEITPTMTSDLPPPSSQLEFYLATGNSLETGKLSAPSWEGAQFYWQNSLTGAVASCGATVGRADTYLGSERGNWLPAWSGLENPSDDLISFTNYSELYYSPDDPSTPLTRPIFQLEPRDGIFYFSARLFDSQWRASPESPPCGLLIDTQPPQTRLVGLSLNAGPPHLYPENDLGAISATEELSGLQDIILYYRRLEDPQHPSGDFYQQLYQNYSRSNITLENNIDRIFQYLSPSNLSTTLTQEILYSGYYQFFLQATDAAGNYNPWPDDPSTLEVYEVTENSNLASAHLELSRGNQKYYLNRHSPSVAFDLETNPNLAGWITHPLLSANSLSLQTEKNDLPHSDPSTRTFLHLTNQQNNYLPDNLLSGDLQNANNQESEIPLFQHTKIQTLTANLGTSPNNFYTLAFDFRVKSDQRLPNLHDPLWSIEICHQKIFNFNSSDLPSEKDALTGLFTQDWQRIYLNLAAVCQATPEELQASYKNDQFLTFSWGEQSQPDDILELDLANFSFKEIFTTTGENLNLRSSFNQFPLTTINYQLAGETIQITDQNSIPLNLAQTPDNNGQINFFSHSDSSSNNYQETGSPIWIKIDNQNPPRVVPEKSLMRGEKLTANGQKYLCRASLALTSNQTQPVFITGQLLKEDHPLIQNYLSANAQNSTSDQENSSTSDQTIQNYLTNTQNSLINQENSSTPDQNSFNKPNLDNLSSDQNETSSHHQLAQLGEHHLQLDSRWQKDWRQDYFSAFMPQPTLSSLVSASGITQEFWLEWQPETQDNYLLIQVWGQSLSHDPHQGQIIFDLAESCRK